MPNDSFDPRSPAGSQPGDDSLPVELHSLHRQLVEDGAAWRAHVPPAQSVVGRARAHLLASAPTAEPEQSATTALLESAVLLERSRPLDPGRARPAVSARRGFIATSAAVLLVGLIGGVLYGMASQRPGHAGVAMPTAIQTLAPIPGRWQAVKALTNQPGVPILAPSNPNVVYEVNPNARSGMPTLARSDDLGATWHTLLVPQYKGTALEGVEVRVSPRNANVVFLQGGVRIAHFTPTSCDQISPVASAQTHAGTLASGTSLPPLKLMSAAGPASDSGLCYVLYLSSDGGQHWTPLAFPVAGTLLQGGSSVPLDGLGNIQYQGNRVHLTISRIDNSSATPALILRLITSTDGGKTWQVADASLVQRGVSVCRFVADPSGIALFAEASADNCLANESSPDTIWRSDDTGAHWRKVGTLPALYSAVTDVLRGADPQYPTLLAYIGPTRSTPAEVAFSTDDGATWKSGPASPAHFDYAGPDAVLNDGTVVGTFYTSPTPPAGTSAQSATPTSTAGPPSNSFTIAYFTWKPGDHSWRQVTPVLKYAGSPEYLIVDQASASQGPSLTLVIQTGDMMSPTFDVTRCSLVLSASGG